MAMQTAKSVKGSTEIAAGFDEQKNLIFSYNR